MKPVQINMNTLNSLLAIKNKVVLIKEHSHLLIITDFKYETKVLTKKHFFSKDTTKKVILLTELNLFGWSEKDQYWASFKDKYKRYFAQRYDLIMLRKDFENYFKNAFEAVGMKITKKTN